ncbi:MAG TPA: zf-HC2 domain-containing protein [Gemmatimonadales bacterium]|nr:zf-HC2 domain-containing protein [Gemmatimonadales bacterium]
MSPHLTEEQLNRYADGTLQTAERDAVARHVEECAACRGEVAGLRSVLGAVARLPRAIEPPRDLFPEIHAAIRTHGPTALRGGWAVAAAVALVIAWQFVELAPRNAWRVVALAGTPRIGTVVVSGQGALRVGDWLETDAVSRARIAVGRIGQVDVHPRTRVRLLDARAAAHRLALARGTIEARVDAPPRLFLVETPAGTAIDLGCAYTLEVDSLGNGALAVTAGWVEFSWRERRSIVPLGFTALTRPGVGPGIPWAADAPAELREALHRLDFEGGGAEAVRSALAAARPEDAVSVWHLVTRVERRLRPVVVERLAHLVPPPEGVTRDALVAADSSALERYWSGIRRIAWRREILRGLRDIDPRTGLSR